MAKEELMPDCKNMLSKRLQMYDNAARFAVPEDMQQLYHQVVSSPAKYYFFLMFLMMSSTLFVVGILFGRAFRRHVAIKNK